jgi:hypothetical protein
MTKLSEIILTSTFTLFGGVVVFVLGQVAVKFFVEPIQEVWRTIGEIADSLMFYADLHANPGPFAREKRMVASESFRHQASQLKGRMNVVALYRLWAFLHFLPKKSGIDKACRGLIGLSNSLFDNDTKGNNEYVQQIWEGLGIK